MTAKGNIKFQFVILPDLSFVYHINDEIRYYSIKNVEAWLSEEEEGYLVGMNFLKLLNISMNKDVLTIKIKQK